MFYTCETVRINYMMKYHWQIRYEYTIFDKIKLWWKRPAQIQLILNCNQNTYIYTH